jgi:hypothetical protein
MGVIKSRMGWAGHVALMGGMRNACSILVGKPEGQRPPEDLGICRWMILEWTLGKYSGEGVDWMDVAQDGDQWRTLVNTVMKLRVP